MRKMDARSQALPSFISRIFEMPGLRGLSALQKEEQALRFLRTNGQQLQPLLASMGLASAAGWRETVEALAQEMKAYADRLLEAEIARAIDQRLTFAFYPPLTGGRQPSAKGREELATVIHRVANHPVSRRALTGSLSAVLSDLTDKYIPLVWERRKYIHVEVTRVQRLGLSSEECSDLLRFLLLVRPAAYLHVTPGAELGKDSGFTPVQEPALQRALPALTAQLSSLPAQAVIFALRSALPFPAAQGLEAVSRLAAIFAHRGRGLAPSLIVDRGADSPDKSWFNVGRRNARWHGLDPRMLDELYTVAAENGW